jgi:ribosomal protein S18 acetylase RimI-like enzyme
MRSELVIRSASVQDLPTIVALWSELMEFHAKLDPIWSRTPDAETNFGAWVRERLASDTGFTLLAEVDGKPVGYLLAVVGQLPPVFSTRDRGEICDLAVTASARRQGVGTRLVDEAIARFSALGLSRVELSAASCNSVSQAFWREAGFEPLLVRMVKVSHPD